MGSGTGRNYRPHIGLRNIKTTLSVIICLLFYHFAGLDGVMIATVSAIICMQDSVEKSLINGRDRLISIGIGAAMAMAFLYMDRYFNNAVLAMVSVGAGVMTLIMICNMFGRNNAIIMSCVVFLSIMLGGGNTDPFIYSAAQLLNTFVGVSVAVLVNRFVPNLAKRKGGGQAGGGAPDEDAEGEGRT